MSALDHLPRGYRVRSDLAPAPLTPGADVRALGDRLRDALAARAIIEVDGVEALRAADAEGAVVLATGLLERDPDAAVAALRQAAAVAAAVVVSTPERRLRHGAAHLGPPETPARAMEWSLDEVAALLDGAQVGLCRGADDGDRVSDVVAILSGAPAARAAAGWLRPELPGRLGDVEPALVLPPAAGRRVRRACFISWQYFEDVFYAGIGRAVAMAAQALAAEGVEVHVITVAPTAERVDERLGDVHIHRVPDRTAHGDPLHLRALGWAAATAERYAELDAEVGFDLVEVPDYHAEGLSLELRPGTALVATLHGTIAVFGDANQADAPTIDLQAFCGLELAALRRADLLLAPTALLLERTRAVATLDADDATVPHAFDVSGFPAREAPASLPEVLTVTFAGRIERRKGPDLAVRAVAAAARRGRRIHLRLVGGAYDGFLDDVVLPLAAELGVEDLSVEPPVGTDELMSIVRSSDCMVLPSRLDNFHFAAVEALASGVPVITTDHNGLTQWFGPEDGLAAPPLADPEVFAERAADRLLDDAWLLASGPRAAAAVRERLDPHRIGERLLDVYETTVARVQARGAATAAADTAREARALDRRRAQAAGGLDTRRRVTLVSEREIHERPDLLGAYAAVTCGDDDASLLIVSHEAPDVVAPRILDLLRDLGLDADGAPDMVLSPEVRDGGAALAPMLTAVLSEQPLPPELAAVPCVGADGAGRIAGLILPTTGSAA